MPSSNPSQMMSAASTMRLATTQPTRIRATLRIVRISTHLSRGSVALSLL